MNGDVTDFLVADNRVYDTDNIGIDTIGWEAGTSQVSHGIVSGNVVANVDTWSNRSYGRWNGSACAPLTENAGGIYNDGAAYIWIRHNTVWNTDQGISIDVETPERTTGHLLVTGNTVLDGPGTAIGDPSTGSNPPGVPGTSSVAGHAYDAFYVDAFGARSTIVDVCATDNTFVNESPFYGAAAPQPAPVVDLGGRWRTVVVWDNTIEGLGGSDRLNSLVEVDDLPLHGSLAVVDGNAYAPATAAATYGTLEAASERHLLTARGRPDLTGRAEDRACTRRYRRLATEKTRPKTPSTPENRFVAMSLSLLSNPTAVPADVGVGGDGRHPRRDPHGGRPLARLMALLARTRTR